MLCVVIKTITLAYVLMAPVCLNKVHIAIYIRKAFAASILRLLHQVYGKMLNYKNQNVHLPKIAPVKKGCRGVWDVQGVLGVNRGWFGEKERHPYRGLYSPLKVVHGHLSYLVVYIWEGGLCGKTVLLELK